MARPRKRFESDQQDGVVIRAPVPTNKQVLGIVEERMGFGKSRVRCTDGKLRLCRVPGAMRRDLWIRPGNIVLVEKWEIQTDERGDVVYQYRPAEVEFLKRKGYLQDFAMNEF